MVYSKLNWEIQDQYLEIFKEFLVNKIISFEFCERLEEKLELNEELSNTLRFDVIHEKASNFTDFLDNLLQPLVKYVTEILNLADYQAI